MTDPGPLGTPRVVEPLVRPPDVTVTLPGSKSITNRVLVAAALAEGTTTLTGALVADDTEAMLGVLAAVGVRVDVDGTTFVVHGTGGRIPAEGGIVDVRQSGTTARFVPPLLALGRGGFLVDGDPQMRARPMGPTIDALRQLGLVVEEHGDAPGHLPVLQRGGPARGGVVTLPGDVSSQFVSGLLLAGCWFADGIDVRLSTDLVSEPYVEMTRGVLAAFGVQVDRLRVAPQRSVSPGTYAVEPDASAASYLLAAAAITGGRVRIEGLGRASLQGDVAFAEVLAMMGAQVDLGGHHVEVRGTGTLRGVEVDMEPISDTVPTLAAVAAFAAGPTRMTGVGFIRAKESDRIAATVTELRRCGLRAEEEPDGLVVHPGTPQPSVVRTYRDHRMAMAFALLGLRVPGIAIADPGCVAKTFPGYWDALEGLRHTGEGPPPSMPH